MSRRGSVPVLAPCEAVAEIAAGSTIAIGGFQLNRVPVALLDALGEAGAVELVAVSAPNPIGLDILARHGALCRAECGFIGLQFEAGFAIPAALASARRNGDLRLDQPDVHTTLQSLRAAAAGGRARADFALLHVQEADADGNLWIEDPHLDRELAAAGTTVVASAERLVPRVQRPTIAGDRVRSITIATGGAAPTGCLGNYGYDVAAIGALTGRGPAAVEQPEPAARRSVDALVVDTARQLRDGETVATGLASAAAMLAIELARRTHAPSLHYLNCTGAVDPVIDRFWASSADARLRRRAAETIELPELFDLAEAGGVDTMLFGAAQVDPGARINLTRIGPEAAPRALLPGPAGSPSMRSWVRRVLVMIPRASDRCLVPRVDQVTSAPAPRNEETIVVSDIGSWRLADGLLQPTTLAADIAPAEFQRRVGAFSTVPRARSAPPTRGELQALREIDPEGERYRVLASRPRPGKPVAATQRVAP